MSISCTRSELTAFFFSSTTAVLSTVCHFPFTFLYISPFHSQAASKRIGRQSAAVPTSGATDAVLDRKLRRAWVSLTPQIQQAQIQQPLAQAQIKSHLSLVKLVDQTSLKYSRYRYSFATPTKSQFGQNLQAAR